MFNKRRKRERREEPQTDPWVMQSAECRPRLKSIYHFEASLNDFIEDYNESPPIRLRKIEDLEDLYVF